jgi:hypothetical protein
MAVRSLAAIDDELSNTVKARDSTRAQINAVCESTCAQVSAMSVRVIEYTKHIDRLLAERASYNVCPDTPAELTPSTPPAGA